MSEAAAPALDAPDLSMSDYRALREGREVVKVAVEGMKEPEPKPAAKPPAAPGESGAESGTADEHVEEHEDSTSDDGKLKQGQEDEKKPGQKKGLVDEVIKLRRENRELKSRVAPPPQEQPKPGGAPAEAAQGVKPAAAGPGADDPEPDLNKYTDYQQYQRDLVRWEIRQSQKQQAVEARRVEAENAQRQRATTWQGRISAAAAKPELPNFEAIAFNTTLQVSPVMGDAIMDSELGPEILYHLGSNPDEAARISKLSPIAQVREIGKLEASLAKPADTGAASEDEPAPQKTAISKAPPPIPRPAGSASKPAPSAKSIESMSQQEYRALRESGKL